MKISKTTILILVLHACAFQAYSQVEIPVDVYSGRPSITIPIWNVTSGSISEPVMLSYDASSALRKSAYGVGWSISAGGSVSREVRMYPDDEHYLLQGWLFDSNASTVATYTLTADTSTTTSSDEYHASTTKDWNKLNSFNYQVDTEPDIFHYNIGGISGSFVFGVDAVIQMMPYQDVKIEPEFGEDPGNDGEIIGFTITDNNGFVYSFYNLVSATKLATLGAWLHSGYYTTTEYEMYKTSVTYTREWKLESIYCPDGTFITFDYTPWTNNVETNSHVEDVGFYQYKDSFYTNPTDLIQQKIYSISESYTPLLITNITASTGAKVDFAYADGMLGSIKISDTRRGTTSTEQYVKSFVLKHRAVGWAYDYAANDLGETVQFLESITEKNGCEIMPPYKFEYSGTYKLFPPYNVGEYLPAPKGRDKPFPKIYIYPNEPIADRYRTSPLPSFTSPEYTLDGYDLSGGEGGSFAGILKSITSPEGGTTSFLFSSNEYFDSRANKNMDAPGLRISYIAYHDGFNAIPITKTFEYRDPSTGHSVVFFEPRLTPSPF